MPAVSDGIELLRQFFVWMSELESSIALRESTYVAPWFQVSHVVFVSLFAGSVFFMDLRLVGIGSTRLPFSRVQRQLFPWQMAGIIGAGRPRVMQRSYKLRSSVESARPSPFRALLSAA